MRRPALLILFTLTWFLFSSTLSYGQDVAIEHGKITLNIKKSRKIKGKKGKRAYAKDFKRACNKIGKAMTVGKGPWGYGFLGSFQCYRGKRLVSGKKGSPKWELEIIDGKKETSFTMYRLSPKKKEIAKVVMPPSDFTFKFLGDDEFVDLVSFTLMDSMPIGMIIAKAMIKGKSFSGRHPKAGNSPRFKYEVPKPPEMLTAYTLAWNAKEETWDAEVSGAAKQGKIKEPKLRGKKKRKRLRGGSVSYAVDAGIIAGTSKNNLWAQNAKGPGSQKKELDKMIQDAHLNLNAAAKDGKLKEFLRGQIDSIASLLLDTLAGGYVGVRYGLQVNPGDSIQSETSIFSLLVEIRGGPVQGLRYYYDLLPEKKKKVEVTNNETGTPVVTEEEESITWSRHTLGFSWGFDPGVLVDQITFDPKIGIWTYEATLISSRDETTDDPSKVDDFSLGTTVSFALEIGAEWLADWYTIRTWYGIDSGVSLVKTGGNITSNKFGVDAFFTAGPKFALFGAPVKTALLAFYFFESVSITSGQDEDKELAQGEVEITGIDYDAGYAGGGVALSW
jgi:hypothetical protein